MSLINKYLFLCVLSLGIYARWFMLSQHFTHIDDVGVAVSIIQQKQRWQSPQVRQEYLQQKKAIIYDQKNKHYFKYKYKWQRILDRYHLLDFYLLTKFATEYYTFIPIHWTYAPLQFFFTTFLLDKNQSYKDILFWGRLPSVVFGTVSIFLFLYFLYSFSATAPAALLWGAAIFSFSWENIIYNQQMSSYAIGVLAAVLMLLLLQQKIVSPMDFSKGGYIRQGLAVGILPFMQYQMLFFIPAFLATLWGRDLWWAQQKKLNFRPILKNMMSGAVVCMVCIALLYQYFLRFHTNASIHWNAGPQLEFLFSNLNVGEALFFFIKNTALVLATTLSFVPESSALFIPLSALFIFLSLMGAITIKRPWSIFILLSTLTWGGLILLQKLTLSPTRHSLILLPFFCLLLAQGAAFLLQKINSKTGNTISLLLVGCLCVVFTVSLKTYKEQRQDPFIEEKIYSVLQQFQVEKVFSDLNTINLQCMPSLVQNFSLETFSSVPIKAKTFAFISHRQKLTAPPPDYKIIYRQERPSPVEIDFSQRTQNGSNNFFFYILRPQL